MHQQGLKTRTDHAMRLSMAVDNASRHEQARHSTGIGSPRCIVDKFSGKLQAPVESCAEALLPSSTWRLSRNGMERHCQASTSASNAFLPVQPRLASLAGPGPCPAGRAVVAQQQDQATLLTKPRQPLQHDGPSAGLRDPQYADYGILASCLPATCTSRVQDVPEIAAHLDPHQAQVEHGIGLGCTVHIWMREDLPGQMRRIRVGGEPPPPRR